MKNYFLKKDTALFSNIYIFFNNSTYVKSIAKLYSISVNILFQSIFIFFIVRSYLLDDINYFFILIPFITYISLKIIRFLIKRDRPFLAFPQYDLPKSKNYSCPSNHVGASFILSYFFYIYSPIISIICFNLSLILGLARVIEGKHFPLDVIIGFFFSTLIAFYFFFVYI